MMLSFLSPSNGIVNAIITAFGGQSVHFMAEPAWFKTIYVFSGIWQEAGWGCIIYLAALAGIDPHMYEAAVVDGASLNLKEPVTTDDWYQVLKAFKEKDPNGNGKPDEIPFSANSIGYVRSLVRAWGLEDTFYIPKDTKEIRFGPIEDKFKEALTWMNMMYKEGLLDKEFAINDEKAFQIKVSQNLVGAYRGTLGGHLRAFNETLPKTIPGFKLEGTAPIKGPYGDQKEPLSGIVSGGHTVITKQTKMLQKQSNGLTISMGKRALPTWRSVRRKGRHSPRK